MDGLARKDVLIVDHDEAIRNLLGLAIRRSGHTCDVASDGLVAVEHIFTTTYNVILTDIMMPNLDGIGFVRQLKAFQPAPFRGPIILIMTAFDDGASLPLVDGFVHAIIRKPFDLEEVAALIHECVRLHPASQTGTALTTC